MSGRNETLAKNLSALKPKVAYVEAAKIPNYNAVNTQGVAAYKTDKWMQLISLLNTSKVEPQFYRSVSGTLTQLNSLIEQCAKENPYQVAQCIVYSRTLGEGLRTINQVAAALLAGYISGTSWGQRFYSAWDKKNGRGGTIYRLDDMAQIVAAFKAINGKSPLTNAMRKGFKTVLENADPYTLLKYKNDAYNMIRLCHPNPNSAKGVKLENGEWESVITAIRNGAKVSADTWEAANSKAGQMVAEAVKSGKVTQTEAAELLSDAKAENWKGLLSEGKLGILAALRNIRSILLTCKGDSKTIGLLCALVSDGEKIRKGLIFPYQIDMAYEILKTEFGQDADSRAIAVALLKGYEAAVPNLAEILTGRNAVYLDLSGSMWMAHKRIYNTQLKKQSPTLCGDKACLMAATIAKATNADIIQFGSTARKVGWNANADVFSLAKGLNAQLGSTSLASAFKLSQDLKDKYDRIIIISDNECNVGSNKDAYKSYIQNIGNPYIYSIDLASYGTVPVAGDKVRYYAGYGYAVFEDITKAEFNPNYHIDKIKKIVI